MGLTPGASRAAAFAQHLVPQAVGGVVGGVAGYGVALFMHFGTNMNWSTPLPGTISDYLPAFGYSIVSSLAFAALGLAIASAGAFFASRAPKERTPVEALRPVG
jgi:ABC-type antimicrobial peptide transport system permease subunit